MAHKIELDVKFVRETSEAWWLKFEGTSFCIPKSCSTLDEGRDDGREYQEGDDVMLTLPESMAIDKGMI